MDLERFANRIRYIKGDAIRELLNVSQQPGMISFAGGLPSAETFDTEMTAQIAKEVMEKDGANIMQYGPTAGYAPLVKELLKQLRKDGFDIEEENLLVTSGAQQGLDLAIKVLVEPGDVIVCESPSYLAALQLFRTYEAKLVVVPFDKDGMIVSELRKIIAEHKPKVIYSIPTFQNPSSATMTMERRRELCDILKENEVVLIEDNPYGYLNYEEETYPSIYSMDETHQTIYVGTFSKIVSPGLRVGYAIANADMITKMNIAKQGTDVQTNSLSQAIIAEYYKRDLMEGHIKSIVELYRGKRDRFHALMTKYFPKEVKWNYPKGGLFIWVELPEGFDAQDLFEIAMQNKVVFVPGEAFMVGGEKNYLRLNFSNASYEDMDIGLQRLGKALHEMLGK